jgi:hypothetical protein
LAGDRARACDVVGRIGQTPRVMEPAPHRGSEPGTCPSCCGRPTWEPLVDEGEERWLAVCRCGRMQAYLPAQPSLDYEDPLRAFLLGPGRPIFPASPPWARVFLASVEGPDPVRWRFCHAPCRGCGANASFGFQACPREGVLAICTLCLACGYASACYSKIGTTTIEGPVGGRAWAPACVAVQRLRDCLHRPYSLLRVDGWRVTNPVDPGRA